MSHSKEILLARGMSDYRPDSTERKSIAAGRLLVLTAFPPEVRRTTRETALARNRLVLALCDEALIPHVAEGSPLASLVAEAGKVKENAQ